MPGKGEGIMAEERTNELKKLMTITTDLEIPSELRIKAVEQIGRIGTHEALLALLELVANERLVKKEREFAWKQAGDIIKSGR
jgi:HEAT repeat protein